MSLSMMKPGSRVLFQGDSITDAGRGPDEDGGMGQGYPLYVSSLLSARYPQLKLEFINRGISGHRICDLEARWTKDCTELQPDVVSILIGINDTWRRYDSNAPSDIAEFESCYRRLLDRIRSETKAEIMILEPFLLHIPEDRAAWREDLDPRIQAVRRVVSDYKATFVPLDGIFTAAATKTGPSYWAGDGVHPSAAGHALIAEEWIKAIGG